MGGACQGRTAFYLHCFKLPVGPTDRPHPREGA